MSITSIKDIMPYGVKTDYNDIFIPRLKKFIFDNGKIYDDIDIFIKNADNEIINDLEKLKDIELYSTSFFNKNLFIKLINNILLICNLDYIYGINKKVTSIEKIIHFIKRINKYEFKVCIKFADLTSPYFILKIITKNENNKDDFLNEYINSYILNFINTDVSNMITSIGLISCDTFINTSLDDSSIIDFNKTIPTFCSCIGKYFEAGKKHREQENICSVRNYLLYMPFIGTTIQNILENETINLFIDNFDNIYKQIILILCITQNKLGFIHNEFTLNNIIIDTTQLTNLDFIYKNNNITIKDTYKVNINNFYKSEFKKIKDPSTFITKTIYSCSIKNYNNNDSHSLTDQETLIDLKKFINHLYEYFNNKDNKDFFIKIKDIKAQVDKSKNIDEIFITNREYEDELNKDYIDSNRIEFFLNIFSIKDIVKISNEEKNIYIDGYDERVYGPEPKFDYNYLLNSFNHNDYAYFGETGCISNGKKKLLKFNNPSEARYFKFGEEKVYFNNIKPSKLPKPTNINDRFSYTYSIVKNKYNNKFEINYGRIYNLTEIGVRHNLISYNNNLLVSGELSIKKINDNNYEYVLNINSSKINVKNSRLNELNKDNYKEANIKYINTFYYIIMINLALQIFKLVDNTIDIKPSSGIIYRYDSNDKIEINEQEKLVDYYTNNICPSPEFIDSYNKFTLENNINSCISLKTDEGEYKEIKQINFNNKKIDLCNHMKFTDDLYKQKYLKYKKKYTTLKNQKGICIYK